VQNMISYRKIQALVFVLLVVATTGPKAEARGGGFRGGGFRGGFGGRSGFRAPSFGYFRGGSRVVPGYASRGFRTGYGFRSAYGYAGYRPYGYGVYGRERNFRLGYGYGSPYWYGYPYGYGYPYTYGYPFGGWGYGYPYAGYPYAGYPYLGYPYLGYGDYGLDLSSGPSYAGGWQGPMAGIPDQGQSAAATDSILQGAGAPAFMGRLQWPLGLQILPGADSLRESIDGLYATAAAQAATGKLNPQLPSQLKQAVKELQRLVARDKQEHLTLSSAMYKQAEEYLHELTHSAARFAALEASPNTNAGTAGLVIPLKK
jgi:hypothetical protein